MALKNFLFTSESVTEGHPDKVCDQISDAILDEFLTKDSKSRVAAETTVTTGMALVCGEITSNCYVDIPTIVRNTIKSIGYNGEEGGGFDYKTCAVLTSIDEQSIDIAGGVNKALETRNDNADTSKDETLDIGAGDQGIMFGYACNETENKMPYGFDVANKIIKLIENDVETNPTTILIGDAKTQVTLDLESNTIYEIVISVCHKEGVDISDVRKYILKLVEGVATPYRWTINPSGAWNIGGPTSDCGLTGRKIVCDQYGGYCTVGGGAFSGKDPTKVDRSASYMARKIACDMLDKHNLKWCTVQLGYAIGIAEPVSIMVANDLDLDLAMEVRTSYNLTPKGIIEYLDLYNLNYEELAEGCHFNKYFR